MMKTAGNTTSRRRLTNATHLRKSLGFTLIEGMFVLVIMGVLLALAAPSMQEMIQLRRLRGITDQLVTDLQFARSEAIARRAYARIDFNSTPTMSCYSIYTAPTRNVRCNCAGGATGATCDAGAREIRTARIPKSLASEIIIPDSQEWQVGFEPSMGSLVTIPVDFEPAPLGEFKIDAAIDAARTFRVVLLQSGRPSVCKPEGSHLDVGACP